MSGSGKAAAELPSALARIDEIEGRIGARRPAVFLDYDGTLTPIVDRPEQAVLADGMRATLERLARVCKTAVVSGRALEDVRELVDVTGLYYAGNHGLQISGPDETEVKHEKGREYLGLIEKACEKLEARLGDIEGSLIENKKFSLSVHYRLVGDSDVPAIEEAVDELVESEDGLRKHSGKKVFEIRPRIDWDKGKAVLWLLDVLELDEAGAVPIYIGDDVTDEDAFRALRERGIGIRVLDGSEPSRAQYRLNGSGEVRDFLEKLATIAEQKNE